MASQVTRTSMANSSCEWVRARLALWVGDCYGDGQTADTDGGDLCAEDRRQIDRHLDACSSCRQDRTALERALQILWESAGQLPVEPVERSLWPVLQIQLGGNHRNQPLPIPRPGQTAVSQSGRAWAALDDHRPLRRAWARDTVREALRARKWQTSTARSKAGWLPRTCAAVACLVLVIVIPALRRQWSNAQNAILANSAPLPEQALPSLPADEMTPETADSAGSPDVPAHELAESDPVQSPDGPLPSIEGGLTPKKTPSTRFGYDVEHGTPPVPDPRDVKPVY
jgi:hypothetical protein